MSDDSIDPVHPGARVARAAFAPARRPHAWLLPTLFDRLRDEAPSQRRDAMSDVAPGSQMAWYPIATSNNSFDTIGG